MSNDQEKDDRHSSGHSRDRRGRGASNQKEAQRRQQHPFQPERQREPLVGRFAPFTPRSPRDVPVGARPLLPFRLLARTLETRRVGGLNSDSASGWIMWSHRITTTNLARPRDLANP